MGLAGLGLSARAAATVFPGVLRAPAYFTELWVVLGSAAFILLLAAYLVKLVRYPTAVKDEFTNPATLGFCGALPVGMTLVAGGIAPYAPAIADVVWWIALLLLLMFQIWALVRWLSGGIELAKLNAGWLIILVGGIVVPGPGIALGHVEASRFFFGVSATLAPLLTALLLYRDRKSTRLNSSHSQISYAVFCLKKKFICELIRIQQKIRKSHDRTPVTL